MTKKLGVNVRERETKIEKGKWWDNDQWKKKKTSENIVLTFKNNVPLYMCGMG